MGIDLIDITFHLEKECGVTIDLSEIDWTEFRRHSPKHESSVFDLTAGELHQLFLSRTKETHGIAALSWDQFASVVGSVLQVDVCDIHPDKFMVKDLGFE
jgi:hypothetical protein